MDNDAASESEVFTGAGRVALHVMQTDEQLMIAKSVCSVLGLSSLLAKQKQKRRESCR